MSDTSTVERGTSSDPPAPPASASAPHAPRHERKNRARLIGAGVAVLIVLAVGYWLFSSLHIVSTDDAYVNGHVTFVAPRVAGQVARVLVDDNNRVRKGDVLVLLDPEPYLVQVNIAQAAVDAAQSDLVVADAQVRGLAAQARSVRFSLEHAIEDVDNQVAQLRSKVATLGSQRATLDKAKIEYDRLLKLSPTNVVSQKELEDQRNDFLIAQAKVEEALQGVYQVRASLGLPPKPDKDGDEALTEVPPDLDQTFSTVKQAQMNLMQAASALGVEDSFNKSPKQMLEDFYKRDPSGDIDRIYAELFKNAPIIKQAQSKLLSAQRQLDQARLNLSYCTIVSEIDGVVSRRSVNPGNNVIAGQSLMAVRSLTDVWIDANFKETQLASLRIGQPVDLEADMYGSHEHFKGRISGFSTGTGSTLALLPPENATGNFVKVVQRLPVRIDLVDYNPEKAPLFVGLSVEPRVDTAATPTGPDAGKFLQPYAMTQAATSAPETQP